MKRNKKLLREQRKQRRWAEKQLREKMEPVEHEQELKDYVKRNRFPEITPRPRHITLFSEPDSEFSDIPFVDLRTEKCSSCPFLKTETYFSTQKQFCAKGVNQIRWLPHKLVDVTKSHPELLRVLKETLESDTLEGWIALLAKTDEALTDEGLEELEKIEKFPGTTEEFFSFVEEEFIPSCELLKELIAQKLSQKEMFDLLFSYA